MDKKAIKTFAIESRVKLREGVMNKLAKLGITNKGIEEATKIGNDTIEIPSNGERFTDKEVLNRIKLVDELRKREKQTKKYDIAYDTLVEEVAYTWFNRLIAVRFMEVNDYLPGRQRVLSSEMSGKREPDVITNLLETDLYSDFDVATKERITELLSDGSAAAVDELYQLVFIKLCNSLNKQLPDLFEKIDDYTELLFIISYIDENGVIASLLSIPEDDFNVDKGGQVEIIGWMYQYYNTEPKGKVFARGSRKIRADEIPAATQLFTPDWIVRYMVENSLGRYYIDQKMANPTEARTEKEIAEEFGWKYYIPTAEQPEDVKLQITDERKDKSVIALQELKLLDNAMGSGHILVYAFDMFIDLYRVEGYREREAAELIMKHNLFGLEIDKRAYQLAYFAIMMKGRQYNRRVLYKDIKLNLHQFVGLEKVPTEYYERLKELSPLSSDAFIVKLNDFKSKLLYFEHASEIGSILNLHGLTLRDIQEFRDFINVFDNYSNMDILYGFPEVQKRLNEILNIMTILVTKYSAVVTNPPYLNKMSTMLGKYVKDNYPNVKTDLFSVFIKVNGNMLMKNGYAGFMTPFVWMFIKSYEELRKFLITKKSISSLIQMEYSAFEEATVPICCFTIKNTKTEPVGNYFKLSDFRGGMEVQKEKVIEAIQDPNISYFYQTNQNDFMKIPGSPISFWVNKNLIHDFVVGTRMDEILQPKVGLQTGSNDKFIRLWWEVDQTKVKYDATSISDSVQSRKKWFPYNKGGSFRRWYGNSDYIVNWENDGYEIKSFVDKNGKQRSRPQNTVYYFREAITYSAITSGKSSYRFQDSGMAFDHAAYNLYIDDYFLLGFLNSVVSESIIKTLNPTINAGSTYTGALPIIRDDESRIEEDVKKNIQSSRLDWDSFETSWNFLKHPLL
ncbi:BREX-1 system adenine-specific DNA-methyltransferase PglX [Marinilactibacillus psychrotolerans]|uniref:BREX-1 system adenine-specific DNA-methyltransferase PglX n=1 Tax=Marinilactibacillus psychrotolerans TaxID=191770 RepID=UPI00388469A5